MVELSGGNLLLIQIRPTRGYIRLVLVVRPGNPLRCPKETNLAQQPGRWGASYRPGGKITVEDGSIDSQESSNVKPHAENYIQSLQAQITAGEMFRVPTSRRHGHELDFQTHDLEMTTPLY